MSAVLTTCTRATSDGAADELDALEIAALDEFDEDVLEEEAGLWDWEFSIIAPLLQPVSTISKTTTRYIFINLFTNTTTSSIFIFLNTNLYSLLDVIRAYIA